MNTRSHVQTDLTHSDHRGGKKTKLSAFRERLSTSGAEEKGQRDSRVDRVFALLVPDMGSIPDPRYDHSSLSGVISKCRVKSKP